MRSAENIRRIRQERGLSYAELSRRLTGIGHPILDTGLLKIEKGDRRIDIDDLVALAIALETTPNRLLLPEMDIEHAADAYEITPTVRETPPLLWAWATGEVPLGHVPSTAATDRTTRREEVVFSRENRQHHWSRSPAPATTRDLRFAATGIVAFVAEAFRAGASTTEIRTMLEGAIVGPLSSGDMTAGRTKIEVTEDRGVVIHLNFVDGEGE